MSMFFTTLTRDDLRPSFFEVWTADELRQFAEQGVKHLVEVAVSRWFPWRGSLSAWCLDHADAVCTLVSAIVELQSLWRDNATVAEGFYAMRRVEVMPKTLYHFPRDSDELEGEPPLRRVKVLTSLITVVLVPYWKRRLDAAFESSQGRITSARRLRGERGRAWMESLQRVYPAFSAMYDLSFVGFKMAYLFGLISFHSPWLWLQGLVVRRMSGPEYHRGVGRRIPGMSGRFLDRMVGLLRVSVIFAIFFFRISEYVQSTDFRLTSRSSHYLPPPPEVATPSRPCRRGRCPLCDRILQNPLALATSGFVYCADCIRPRIDADGRCPLTGMATGLDQLRPIFDSH
mmetsp:Transcript_8270/g.16767  ORF Transcript_8270/g.16767 Transcript_8270/m.16767 type:complete len:344 (-) Transcript_8270:712-1743(-)|eukprot:CAMPEP_0184680322 /NCGR_PEP_ID=MMETSP0312-20130426/3193_1 /TAXON_ID=31354 /ORGANISM="Compsopogon coeruleus, Strain SAG 36.94" /LENGTH=343 /DNA_ID=CAMNT_0027130357 /DNA_START=154 /DNA_END=1185 /DNA_ORIENTATION=+